MEYMIYTRKTYPDTHTHTHPQRMQHRYTHTHTFRLNLNGTFHRHNGFSIPSH